MSSINIRGLGGTTLNVMVDDVDIDWVNQWKWKLSNSGYVCRSLTVKRGGVASYECMLLHREIARRAGILSGQFEIDHKNRNKLDNTRQNLRSVTRQQNCWNTGRKKTNTTGFIGVSFCKSRQKYCAMIRVDGKKRNLGRFDTPEEARDAYVRAAKEVRDGFCCTE